MNVSISAVSKDLDTTGQRRAIGDRAQALVSAAFI